MTLHERRPDPRQTPARTRPLHQPGARRARPAALEAAGILGEVRPLLIPMRGRRVHEVTGDSVLLPYGQREHEVIYSVSRADLNRVLIDAAVRHAGVQVHFNRVCLGADLTRDELRWRDAASGAHERQRAHAHDRHRRRRLRPACEPERGGRGARAARTGSIMTTRS